MTQPPVFEWATLAGSEIVGGLTLTDATFMGTQQFGNVVYGLIDYQCSGTPDLSGVTLSNILVVSGFTNAENNGNHYVISADNTGKVIRVRMTARLTAALNETGATAAGVVNDIGALLQEPSSQKQARGYIPEERQNAMVLNWMFNSFGAWTAYIASGAIGVIFSDDLTALAAIDTTGFSGRVSLVADIGFYSWQPGTSLTADGYTVVNSDVSGQWVLQFDSLSFSREIDGAGSEILLDYRDEGTYKIHYDADITAGFIDIDIDSVTAETLDDTSTKDFILSRGQGLQIICRNDGEPFGLVSVTSVGNGAYTTNSPDGVRYAFDFNTAGTKVFVTGRNSGAEWMREFNTSAAWTAASPSYSTGLNVNSTDNNKRGVRLSPDNEKIFYSGAQNSRIYQFSMPTPGSLSGASYDSVFISHPGSGNSRSFCLSPDGSRLFYISESTTPHSDVIIYQYNLATPGRIDSVTQPKTANINGTVPTGNHEYSIDCCDNGSRIIVGHNAYGGSTTLYQFTLGTPNEIDTISYDGVSETFAYDANGIKVKPDGQMLFVMRDNGTIYQYRLAELFQGSAIITAEFIK